MFSINKRVYFRFIEVSVASTPSGSYRDFRFLLVEEDTARTNIGIFAYMGRTTDVPQVSWKISQHESVRPFTWKSMTLTAQPWASPTNHLNKTPDTYR